MIRQEIIKKAGSMVIVYYSEENKECFAIGWLYAMDQNSMKLKVTSTKYETYESIHIELNLIVKIENYEFT